MGVKPQHPMGVVTRRTGLRADVIRAWERRHRALEPFRTAGKHRLYSDQDIERLLLIRQALGAGWKIGQVAALDDEGLRELLGRVERIGGNSEQPTSTDAHQQACREAILELDAQRLEQRLEAAEVELGRVGFLENLVVPLVESIGEACEQGTMRVAHEHLTSAVLHGFLASLRSAFPPGEDAPAIIVTTPARQLHELPALLVAATARSQGWRTLYLGPNLPAEEIAAAAIRREVHSIAMSISFPGDDPVLADELRKLRRAVPAAQIVVGGRCASSYQQALEQIDAILLGDLASFRAYLNRSRATSGPER